MREAEALAPEDGTMGSSRTVVLPRRARKDTERNTTASPRYRRARVEAGGGVGETRGKRGRFSDGSAIMLGTGRRRQVR